jgi:hypothetical protein
MGNPQPPAAPAKDRTTLFGVLGIIGAVCCAPLGIVFALLSLMDARKNHKSPVIGYVALGLSGISLIANIILLVTHNNPYVDYWRR